MAGVLLNPTQVIKVNVATSTTNKLAILLETRLLRLLEDINKCFPCSLPHILSGMIAFR